jgi:hypothetical protein
MVTIDEWTEALRSRKFWQGDRNLYDKDTNTYCCLGVLCEISGVNFKSVKNLDVVDIFDLKDSFGKGIDKFFAGDNITRLEYLAFLNDMGLSFNVIAKEIESINNGDDSRYLHFTKDGTVSQIREILDFHMKGN